ncbi:hypothetical protein IRJ41_013630 [Triplophysa rosa]|uniref:Uncharacterized protein n=1 Tax=Triplophysa rosa TaxID=992332 RepID=A0A9W7X022_TRIRA|nr:hypothetical protein IRJ41_013630 [Triplophysa rosa]
MDMEQYVVFRNNKRLSLREEDMTAEKLSRIFQVSTHSLYMTDDTNVANFPGASGNFNTFDLTPRAHYEIHSEDDTSPATTSTGQRFTFMRMPATTSSSTAQRTGTAPPRATVSKTCQRSIFLAEVVGGRLSPSRMVVVRFSEYAIGSHDPMVLTDAQGNAILDSEGTTGSQYWKQNARKILAVQEQAFQELQRTKRRRMSRKDENAAGIGEITEKIEELVLASQSLPDITRAHQPGCNSKSHPHSFPAADHQARVLLCCFSSRSQSSQSVAEALLAAKRVEQWQETSVHCAKCRGNTAGNNIFEINGLSEAFAVLRSLFEEE